MSKIGFKILKLMFLITAITTMIFSLSYAYTFKNGENALKERVSQSINKSNDAIDGDKLEKVIISNSTDSLEYKEVLNSMYVYASKSGVKNLYTLIKLDDKTAGFLVDASGFLDKYEITDEINQAFKGNIVVQDSIYTDEYGTFISAFAPIKNSSGKIIAVVGADCDAKFFADTKNLLYKSLIITIVLNIIISIILVLIFSNKLKANIKNLSLNLDKMSNGDLTEEIKLNSNDEIEEIGTLLNKFRINIGGILYNVKSFAEDIHVESGGLSQISNEMSA